MTTMRTLLISLLLSFAGCSKSEPPPAPEPVAKPARKDPAAARTQIAAGALVLDVRTPEEFAEDHLPQAVNVPVNTVAGRLDEVAKLAGGDKARSIVVYCAAGARAAEAKHTLEGAGYTHVVNGGGLDDLK